MSKRVLCKFYAHGACLKGEHCEFSHDWKDPSNNVCTFYQKGICSYGSRCRYDHVKLSQPQPYASSSSTGSHQFLGSDFVPVSQSSKAASGVATPVLGVPVELSASSKPFFPPTIPAWSQVPEHPYLSENGDFGEHRGVTPAERSICSFAAAGSCPRGEKCPHIHGDLCPLCGKHCLHPFRPEEREEHMKTCEKKQKHLEALKHSQEIECSVCLERVLSKPTAAERKFGLLSECDHPFCISCIRNWRSNSPSSGMDVNSALRACPICRKLSYFVIPSVIWHSNKDEKQEIVDSYKAKLKSIDCRHFDFGNGSCPFGTSCFYKHTVKPGSYAWNNCMGYDVEPDSYVWNSRMPNRVEPALYAWNVLMHRAYSSNDVDVDSVRSLFEHVYRPHKALGREAVGILDAEDLDNEELTPEDMFFLLTQMELETSDSDDDGLDDLTPEQMAFFHGQLGYSSSDEEFFTP